MTQPKPGSSCWCQCVVTAQALVFLLVSVCCDSTSLGIPAGVSVTCALVFLLVSVCRDTAQTLVFLLESMCCGSTGLGVLDGVNVLRQPKPGILDGVSVL